MTAIPGPTESPAVQTARWVARPIRFLEDCRRTYGETFSVTFQGFQTPLVMVSNPEVIRALYGERGHKMPPGRQVTLKPLVGARSLLLLEGDEHLSRRKVMLPPFHGDRMRAYEPVMREITDHELDGWPEARAFAVHPSMQAITLEVILRAVFGTRDARLRVAAARPARGDDVDGPAGVGDVRAPQAARAAAQMAEDIDGCCSRRSRSGGAPRARTSARCSCGALRRGSAWTITRSATS